MAEALVVLNVTAGALEDVYRCGECSPTGGLDSGFCKGGVGKKGETSVGKLMQTEIAQGLRLHTFMEEFVDEAGELMADILAEL